MTYDYLLFPMLVLAFVLALSNFTLQLRTIAALRRLGYSHKHAMADAGLAVLVMLGILLIICFGLE